MFAQNRLKKTAYAAFAAAAVFVGVGAGTGAAVADPSPLPDPSDCNPAFRAYAAVGSDTTQDVWNGLTNGVGAVAPSIASWDAFGTSPIVTKCGGDAYTRPAGSGNGVKALSAVWDPAYSSHAFGGGVLDNEDVDFARSSSGPVAGTGLKYLPFARDAVSVAIKPFASGTPTNFTTAQLAAIYGGADDNVPGTGVTYDASTGKPVVGGVVLTPKIPQGGSGTRSFFQTAIGITTADLAAYVETSGAPSTLPENDGTVLTAQGDLIAFSAAQWIAQRNGATADTTTGLNLLDVNGSAPTTGTGPLAPGALFGSKDLQGRFNTVPATGLGVFNRDTYNVVPVSFLTGTTKQQSLVALLTDDDPGQLGSSDAQSVISTYGFGNLSYLSDPTKFKDGAFQH